MPEYTLNYFNLRGRAQLIRLLFTQAEIAFTDHRIEFADWAETEKKNRDRYPFGTMPTLAIDGKILPETIPIARYLANEFGLAGKSNLEKAWCDVFIDVLMELKKAAYPFTEFYMKMDNTVKSDEEKNEVFNGFIANKLAVLERFFKENKEGKGYLVGDEITWADLFIIDCFEVLLSLQGTCLDATPLLKELRKRLMTLPKIKAFMDAREPSDL